jgi:hypothetical protein
LRKAAAASEETAQDDEIDIDDLDDDEGPAPAAPSKIHNVSTKQIPAAVFGGLAGAAAKKE